MPLTTTQIAFPPIQSQATEDFIAANVVEADRHGSMVDDFKKALANNLTLDANDYSIDDLWALYILGPIAADTANTSPGNSAAARGKNVGQHPRHYYPPAFLRNPGNVNRFPMGGDPIEHYIYTNYTASDTVATGTVYEDPTNGFSFPQSALTDGDEYMLYYRGHINMPATDGTVKITHNNSLMGQGFQRAHSTNMGAGDERGKEFGFAGFFTADSTGTDVKIQMYGGSTSLAYEKRSQAMLINLTSDLPNHVKMHSNTSTTITSGEGYKLTDTSVVLPPGDFLLFTYFQYAGWSYTFSLLEYGLQIAGTNYILSGRYNPSGQYHGDSAMMLLKNFAGGEVTMVGKNGGGGTIQTYGKTIIAINLKDVKEWYGNQSLANVPTPMTAARYADEIIDTLTVPSIVNDGDFLNLAWMSHDSVGTDATIGIEATTDVNSAGDALVAWNNDYQDRPIGSSAGDSTHGVLSDVISTYAAGDSVTQKLAIASEYTIPSDRDWNLPGQAIVMMEKADAPEAVTQVAMNNLSEYSIDADTVLNWGSGTTHDDGVYNSGFLGQYGERFYATGNSSNEARIYHLSTPWDPSTYTYVGYQSTHGAVPCGYWEDEATGMYHAVADWSGGDIDFYSNANAWAPTDATRTLIGTWTPPESTEGFHVSRDGVYIYTYNKVGGGLHRFKNFIMSTPWDPSTASLIGEFTPSETSGARIWVSKDGADMITSNLNNSTIQHHRMSTAHDLTTCTLQSSMSSPTVAVSTHIWMSDDGERLYLSKHNQTGDHDIWIRTYSGSTIDPT